MREARLAAELRELETLYFDLNGGLAAVALVAAAVIDRAPEDVPVATLEALRVTVEAARAKAAEVGARIERLDGLCRFGPGALAAAG